MEQLKEAKELINDLIGLDQPWPLTDILKKLIEASEILLYKKDYDGHSHEEINLCVNKGKGYIEMINNHLSTIKEPEEKQCMSCEKIISKNEVFVFCEDCSGYKDHVKTKLITDIDIKHDKEIVDRIKCASKKLKEIKCNKCGKIMNKNHINIHMSGTFKKVMYYECECEKI